MSGKQQELIFKRRFPRRNFANFVGLMAHGAFSISQGLQVGEGGLRISGGPDLIDGQVLLLTFAVGGSPMGVIRGVVKYRINRPNVQHEYGIEFDSRNLDPNLLISIRSYVAQKSEAEAEEEIQLWRRTIVQMAANEKLAT